MKILGRFLLIVAMILLLSSGIPSIIQSVNALNAAGWQNAFANANNIAYFVTFISGIIDCFLAFLAFGGVIRGRKSIGLALTAILMIIGPAVVLIFGIIGGLGLTWQFYVSLTIGFLTPVIYFLGFLFI